MKIPRSLFFVVPLALAVRVPLLFLPLNSYYERIQLWIALRSLLDHFNPGFFIWPSLYYDLLALLYGGIYAVMTALGRWEGVPDLIHFVAARETIAVLPARLISLAAAVSMVLGTYALAKRAGGDKVAHWSALTVALLPLTARYSVLARVDSLVAGLAPWALLLVLKWAHEPTRRNAALGGITLGLCVSTHFIAAPFLIAWAAGAWFAFRQRNRTVVSSSLLHVCLAAAGTFVLTSPYVLMEYKDVFTVADSKARLVMQTGSTPTYPVEPWWFYVRVLFGRGTGFLPGYLALIGIGLVLPLKNPPWRVLLLTLAGYFVALSIPQTRYPRYMLPIFPLMAVFAGYGLHSLDERLRPLRAGAGKIILYALALFPLVTLALNGRDQVRFAYDLNAERRAMRWITQNVPPGARLLVDEHALRMAPILLDWLPRPDATGVVRDHRAEYVAKYRETLPPYDVEKMSCAPPTRFCSGGEIIEGRFDYVVVLSVSPSYDLLPWLREHAERVVQFQHSVPAREVPWVQIYRLGPSPAS